MGLSRIQLAAALVEYDNDPDSPIPRPDSRSHRDSAIFLPYQRAQQEARRRQIFSQPPPVLPSPLESNFPSGSNQRRPDSQARRRSTVTDLDLGGPASSHDGGGEDERAWEGTQGGASKGEEDVADVDVSRWGLPSHLVTDNPHQPTARRVQETRIVPQPVTSPVYGRAKSIHVSDVLEVQGSDQPSRSVPPPRPHGRTLSMGDAFIDVSSAGTLTDDRYGADRALAEAERVRNLVNRPHTVMGWQGGEGGRTELRNRKISNPVMVPLPSSPLSSTFTGVRPLSSISRAFTPANEDDEYLETLDEPNPFALPAPPPELGSRFDPKILKSQRRSSAGSAPPIDFETPSRPSSRMSHTLPSRGPEEVSYLDPASPSRTPPPVQRVYDEIPTPAEFGRPLMPPRHSTSAIHRMNRQSLLRPKVLVMPSPLAGVHAYNGPEPKVPEGFVRGEKPLPAEAKTTGRRPGIPLSLSQKTFRSSLLVGGRREDEEYWLGGTEEEGEIAVQRRELGGSALEKKPGKLYGRSLMDELEARKAAQKGRQRVFTGDSRPAMMARNSALHDSSALATPQYDSPTSAGNIAQPRPVTYHSGAQAPLLRVQSGSDLRTNADLEGNIEGPGDRITKSRSVFGVDQLWEREMTKLRMIQDDERIRKEEEEARRLLAEQKKQKKGKKDKGKGKAVIQVEEPTVVDERPVEEVLGISPIRRAGSLPPAIDYSPEKVAPVKVEDEEETRSENEDGAAEVDPARQSEEAESTLSKAVDSEEESDEDVPLSKLAPAARSTITKASTSMAPTDVVDVQQAVMESESDEDIPLSKLALKSPSRSSGRSSQVRGQRVDSLGLVIPAANDDDNEDEDDLPLAVRQAKAKGLKPITKAEIIEDDLPLGYKHAEKAQQQMAERTTGGGWDGTGTMYPLGQGMSPARMAMSSYPNQAMWGIPPHMSVYMGMGMGVPYPGMGHPSLSMPDLHQAMVVGMGDGQYSNPPYTPMTGQPPSAGNNIDSWRQDVALAPVPTGGTASGSGGSAR
ncbi:hypothetical protein CI109_100685 [Kwoniella shandongensis]|uniref:Uncharacterized protein n=1 Tax=Kwoniella shandongensis TaxID=1734106 RepID=A0A5M6BZ42_9TREE|nr:uncharacterized protein CI109_003394 [Kwoniella shandongensis]KAA5528106.1 hypothetical protein CI109_003394 [Kwoniella shandongensis]